MAERISKENEIDNVFRISSRATRSLDHQVFDIAKENLHINESKGAAHEKLKDENGGKLSAHEKGQGTGIYGWPTYHKYVGDFQTFAHYCRCEFGVKDIHDIQPQMAVSFCHELGDLDYAKNTVNGYISSIEKFGAFLKIDFHPDLQSFKRSETYKGLEEKDKSARAYDAPPANH